MQCESPPIDSTPEVSSAKTEAFISNVQKKWEALLEFRYETFSVLWGLRLSTRKEWSCKNTVQLERQGVSLVFEA